MVMKGYLKPLNKALSTEELRGTAWLCSTAGGKVWVQYMGSAEGSACSCTRLVTWDSSDTHLQHQQESRATWRLRPLSFGHCFLWR